MLCTNLDCLCWMAAILDFRENRAFSMEGFSTVGRKGTNELISGEKPFIAILSNLKCLFTRLYVKPQHWVYEAKMVGQNSICGTCYMPTFMCVIS